MATLHDLVKELGVLECPNWFGSIELPHWPMPHQLEMGKRYLAFTNYLDASDTGCGKTMPAQTHALVMASMGNKVFFAMPPKIVEQAYDEFMEFFPGVDKHLNIVPLVGSPDAKRRMVTQWQETGNWPDIIIGSYNGFRWLNDRQETVAVNPSHLLDANGNKVPMNKLESDYKGQPVFTRDGRAVIRRRSKTKVKGIKPMKYRAHNPLKNALALAGFNVYFFDEAHRELCNPDNISHRAISHTRQILNGEMAIYLMTATPIPTEVENVYGIIKLVNPTAYADKFEFERKHCIFNANSQFRQITGYKHMDRVYAALYRYGRRVEKRDVDDRAEPLITQVPVKLSGAHKKLYDQILTQRMAMVGDEVLTIESDQELRQTALRIIGAPEQFDPGRATKLWEENELRNTCDEYVEQICGAKGKKVLIVSYFKSVVQSLAKHYARYNPAVLYGETTNAKQQIDRFNNDPDCQVFVIQWKSGGAGLNLQKACSTVIFYEAPTSPADARQVIGRVDRKGQKENINVYFFRVIGTLADRNFRRLLKNDEQNQQVMRDRHDLLYKTLGVSGKKSKAA